MTMWILMYRIPYMYVTDGYFYMDSNSFIFFSGLLSIPSCWIAWITYSKKLKQNLLPLLITLLGLSITVLFIGLSMGFVQKTRVLFEQKNKQPELRESIYKSILNETMIGKKYIFSTTRIRCNFVSFYLDLLIIHAESII